MSLHARPIVIVESPYAGDLTRNLKYARLAVRDSILRGEAPFASHLMYAANEIYADRTPSAVPLTRGLHAFVDEADLERVTAFKWFAAGERGQEYAARHVRLGGKQRTIYMHRFLLDLDEDDDLHVDHWNGNRLDNTRINLRTCSRGENLQNQKLRTDSKSGFKGVTASTDGGRWRANIRVEGEQVHLGTFDTREEAARAYDAAAHAHFGRFARLNFDATYILNDNEPSERLLGIEVGFAFKRAANFTAFYLDNGWSSGMKMALEFCKVNGLKFETRYLEGWR